MNEYSGTMCAQLASTKGLIQQSDEVGICIADDAASHYVRRQNMPFPITLPYVTDFLIG
jgi:hypothetical protein